MRLRTVQEIKANIEPILWLSKYLRNLGRKEGEYKTERVQKQPAHFEELKKKHTQETLHWVATDMRKRTN